MNKLLFTLIAGLISVGASFGVSAQTAAPMAPAATTPAMADAKPVAHAGMKKHSHKHGNKKSAMKATAAK